MNNARRRAIARCIRNLRGPNPDTNGIMAELEDILAEEDDARDNMPENLQESIRYDESEEASDHLNEAISSLSDISEEDDDSTVRDQINDAIEALNNIN